MQINLIYLKPDISFIDKVLVKDKQYIADKDKPQTY